MKIGELSARAGVSPRAIRYYEEQGLLESRRSAGGHRQFAESAVARVAFFQTMFAAGLSSRRIADMLPCFDNGTTTAQQRAMLAQEHAGVSARIDELVSARQRLEALMAAASERADAP